MNLKSLKWVTAAVVLLYFLGFPVYYVFILMTNIHLNEHVWGRILNLIYDPLFWVVECFLTK